MPVEFDFVSAADKPALLGLSTPELVDSVQTDLTKLGYKVHLATNHGEFLHRFGQTAYQIIVLEEHFAGSSLTDNESLQAIQNFPMPLRRQGIFVLFGESLSTFNPLQAFQLGVHAVVNPAEMFLMGQLVEKAVADNDYFLQTFRDAQRRLA